MHSQSEFIEQDATSPPLRGSHWIRAGWLTISIGFVAAFICAVVLGQQIRRLEMAFSTFHRWSQFVMLAGCILLAVGYRLRHLHRSSRWRAERASVPNHGDRETA